MPTLEENVGRPINVVSATWKGDLRCPKCDSPLRYAYAGVERTVEDLHHVIKLRQHYYLCTDNTCPLHKAFHAPHNIVLPYKQYSRKVYEKAIRLYHEVGNNPKQIQKSLKVFDCKPPSVQTIQRYLDEYLFLQSDKINNTLKKRIEMHQVLVIIVDGQRPKRGAPSLWSFLDLMTGEHIHAEYLKKADADTLGEIFLRIQQKFGCEIAAVISDHQISIVNAVSQYIPNAKHQFCHFHFLNNLADPLQKMDSHLSSMLEGGVNQLYINIANRTKKIQMAPQVYRQIQDFFNPIMADLKALVQYPSRTFDTWGGMESYEAIMAYTSKLKADLLPMVDEKSRISKILNKTLLKLNKLCTKTENYYEKLADLLPKFDIMREILGKQALTKKGMLKEANQWALKLKREVQKSINYIDLDAPIGILTYRATQEEIKVLWYRLYKSHKSGLFTYLDDSRIPRTNTELEREYSQELSFWRNMAGRGKVSYQVQVRGDYWLQTHRHYVPEMIQTLLSNYSYKKILNGREIMQSRRDRVRGTWRNCQKELMGIKMMKKKIEDIKKESRILST